MTAIEVALIVGILSLVWLRFGKKKSDKRLTDDVSAKEIYEDGYLFQLYFTIDKNSCATKL